MEKESETIIEVTVNTSEGTEKRKINYMEIHHIQDIYYGTSLYMEDGDILDIQETYQQLRSLIQATNRPK